MKKLEREVRRLLRCYQGYRVTGTTGKGHLRVRHESGHQLTVSSTPGQLDVALKNLRDDIRRRLNGRTA